MNTRDVIDIASANLGNLSGTVFDVITLSKPQNGKAAVNLAKVISKLSPLVGNLIEFNAVEFLNKINEFKPYGHWKRQDPDFPDALFEGSIQPAPGFEIKAWFPLATEITARFKDSQNHFRHDQTYVAMLAWLPEYVIYGKPKVVDIVIVSGLSVAQARDVHYHRPPDYLVLEPEDTANRTRNLQQTNTSGYKFQGTPDQFEKAKKIVGSWGKDSLQYKPTQEYQNQIRELLENYRYRLDTNFAKMDRIIHNEIETFKSRVYDTEYRGMTVLEWGKLLRSHDDESIQLALQQHLAIR